jgi:excisionase family DNA binding protein
MFDDYLVPERDEIDAFAELDDDALDEWDSLKDLLANLADRERANASSVTFGIPALLGDGDGIARWVLVLGSVRRLSHILRLRQELPRSPWCIAARVIEIGPETIRIGITTTMGVRHDQLMERVQQLLGTPDGTTTELEPVDHRSIDERWLTIDEVAHQLAVKARTVQRWIEIGLIVARQNDTPSGSQWRIRLRQPATHDAVGV